MKSKTPFMTAMVLVVLFSAGCNININTGSSNPDLEQTAAAQALAIQQTQVAQAAAQQNSQNNQAPPVVIVVTATPEAAPAATNTPEPPAVQKPEIVNSTLCWVGPGAKYEVVSSLSKGQFVELLGRGNTDGWIIVKNPIYNDPCWVQAFDIKLDPSIDVKSLQVFYPPVPPTKTPLPPTATPTPP